MWIYTLLPKILNMSITASIVIIFVLLARILLKKSPKIFSYALWFIVLFRLLCPVSISVPVSVLSIFNTPISSGGSMEYIPPNIVHTENPQVTLPIDNFNEIINNNLTTGQEQLVADPLEAIFSIFTMLWLLGIGIILIYSIVSFVRLKYSLVGAVRLRENIYLADQIKSPFVIGIFRPKIYLPSDLEEKDYIILHEKTHIKRLDHIVKLLAFFALCIHFFNPLVWVMYFYMIKDMEMSCDESVIKKLGVDVKENYSISLFSLATGKSIFGSTPLAFGEGDTKSRIKNILDYKKPTFWLSLISLIAVCIIGFLLVTNPISSVTLKEVMNNNGSESDIKLVFQKLDEELKKGAVKHENIFLNLSKEQCNQAIELLKNLKVNPNPREVENYNVANSFEFTWKEISINYRETDAYFIFNEDFTDIIHPSDSDFSYEVINSKEVEQFFHELTDDNENTNNVDDSYDFEELLQAKTSEVDSEVISNFLNLLPHPENLEYNNKTWIGRTSANGEFTALISYNTTDENISGDSTLLSKNALIMFALIEDLKGVEIQINDLDMERPTLLYNRGWADNLVGGDVRDYAESIEKLEELLLVP